MEIPHASPIHLDGPWGSELKEDSGVGFSDHQPSLYAKSPVAQQPPMAHQSPVLQRPPIVQQSPIMQHSPVVQRSPIAQQPPTAAAAAPAPARKPVGGPRPLNDISNGPPPPAPGTQGKALPPTPREPFTSNERSYNFEYASRPSTGRASYIEFEEARGNHPFVPAIAPPDLRQHPMFASGPPPGHPDQHPIHPPPGPPPGYLQAPPPPGAPPGHLHPPASRPSLTTNLGPPPPPLYPDDSPRIASQAYEADYSVQRPGRFSPNRFTRSPSPTAAKQKDSFTLNLIRRDPSSGNQWNVGKISSQHVDAGKRLSYEEGAHSSGRVSPPSSRPAIDIQIETSGYAKFRHMPSRRSMDTTGPYTAAGVHAAAAAALGPDDAHAAHPAAEGAGFSRQVQMAYSKSWTSNLKEKWNRMEQNHKAAKQGHARNHSTPSFGTNAETGSGQQRTTSPGPGMKPRGYVFSSPWDGRCDFRTGNAGRSLRCHHILHDGHTSAYNPLVAENEGGGGTGGGLLAPSGGGPSSVVSELRFNLPSTELLAPDDRTGGGRPIRGGGHQRLGSLSKFWRRGDDSDEDDDDQDISPFEVNVGRERAGGGNRGSRAKLGKLIVYNDGLKMLDLIVAANMGVWWGTWERSF